MNMSPPKMFYFLSVTTCKCYVTLTRYKKQAVLDIQKSEIIQSCYVQFQLQGVKIQKPTLDRVKLLASCSLNLFSGHKRNCCR
jgi:hypothetical protein